MDSHPILLTVNDTIAHLTLNRPGARNALSSQMLAAIAAAIDEINEAESVRAVILNANGPGFCGGHDLKQMTSYRSDADGGRARYKALFESCSQMMQAIVASPKIFIAQVHGIATAAGCQLVGACDMAIAGIGARFGVNGINAGLFCSTPMVALSRNVGRKTAMELLTTGRMMSAKEALQAGLVNKVVPDENLTRAVADMAGDIAAKPARVLALGKQAFYAQLEMPLNEAYAHTGAVITDNMMLDEAREGIGAFIEKRQPSWK